MSEAVELDRLLEVAAGFGTTPMLLTTDANGRPRAAAVALEWDGEGRQRVVHVRVGHRSLTNAAERTLVSLLWPAPVGERFALLVDGEVVATTPDDVPAGTPPQSRAARVGGWVDVRPTSGILHVVGGHR